MYNTCSYIFAIISLRKPLYFICILVVRSKAVVLLLLLIRCFVCFPLVVVVLCLSVFYALLCVLHLEENENAGCFAIIVLQMYCYYKCSVALPHDSVGWYAVCDCGIC